MLKQGVVAILLMLAKLSVCVADGLPPEVSEENPLAVYVSFYIGDIDAVNTADQSFEARVFVRYRWHDSRFISDEKNSETDIVTKPLNEIWHPNLQIFNLQRAWSTGDKRASISSDGTVMYRDSVWGSFSQPLTLQAFPFDQQDFNFQIVAVGYRSDTVRLLGETEQGGKMAFGMATSLSVSDWKVLKTYYTSTPFKPVDNLDISVPSIKFSFDAQRLASYYIVKIILPLVLIVMMSWAVFWMDPLNVASNVGISITSMLTLIAYRFSADANLPKLSYLTSLDYFILASSILVFLSLVQNLSTSALAKQGKMKQSYHLDFACRIGFPLLFVAIVMETLIFRAIF